jgi:hypothetical protein
MSHERKINVSDYRPNLRRLSPEDQILIDPRQVSPDVKTLKKVPTAYFDDSKREYKQVDDVPHTKEAVKLLMREYNKRSRMFFVLPQPGSTKPRDMPEVDTQITLRTAGTGQSVKANIKDVCAPKYSRSRKTGWVIVEFV